MDVNHLKKFIENGDNPNGLMGELINKYNDQYNSAISPFDILINSDRANSIYRNNVLYKCIVDFGGRLKKGNLTNVFYREVWTKHDDNFKTGNLVEFENKHSKEKQWHLFLKTVETKDGYDLSIIEKCNRTFTWQDQETLEILSYPCLLSDKTSVYSDGLETNKFITLADDQILITIQNNPHTKKIHNDKRIMFKHDKDNVYKVTKIQDLVHDGLIYITMSRDTYNEASDNLELNICDYKEPNNDIIIGDDYRITITGSDSIYFGREREYVATVYNGDEIVDNMDILWTLDDNGLAEIISQDGNSCVVKGGNSYGYVNLKCELVGNDEVWSSKEILIRSIM